MRALALAGVIVNVGIVLSGGAVRLTESGLGCPSWPRCTGDSLVPVASRGVAPLHMALEFGNRLFGVVVLAVGVLCVIAALRLEPRRRALVRLAIVLPIGVVAQAFLGGVTVLTGLHPTSVAAHFVLSMLIIAAAYALYVRADEGDLPPHSLVRREVRLLGAALVAAVFVLLILGTVVTGTGPHAGDASSPRFGFAITQVTRLHTGAVWATVCLTVALVISARLTNAPAAVVRRSVELLVVELAQGVIGYVQYFLGVPALLVGIHMLGATLVWIATLRVLYAMRDRGAVTHPAPTAGVARAPEGTLTGPLP